MGVGGSREQYVRLHRCVCRDALRNRVELTHSRQPPKGLSEGWPPELRLRSLQDSGDSSWPHHI